MVAIALCAIGCRLDSGLPHNSCHTTDDCVTGNSCLDGVCVRSTGGGGSCETLFPPASCSQPEGSQHALTLSELQRLLPGRWLWCTGDPVSGMPLKIGPDDVIGFEFNEDATVWWYLVDGGGIPAHRSGFDSGGTVEFLGGQDTLQLNLVLGPTSWLTLNPEMTDGPPMRLRFISHGPSAYYVYDDSGCLAGGIDMSVAGTDFAVGGGGDLGGGAFGGVCDPNVVLPTSCPSANGASCSVCGYANMTWGCLQPCRLGGSDCPASQTCVAFTVESFTRGGDCVGYDGYCR